MKLFLAPFLIGWGPNSGSYFLISWDFDTSSFALDQYVHLKVFPRGDVELDLFPKKELFWLLLKAATKHNVGQAYFLTFLIHEQLQHVISRFLLRECSVIFRNYL